MKNNGLVIRYFTEFTPIGGKHIGARNIAQIAFFMHYRHIVFAGFMKLTGHF